MLYIVFVYLFGIYLLRDKIKSDIMPIILIIPLLMIIWTRYGIGVDYFSYQDIYNKIEPHNFSMLFTTYKDIEIGYKLLMVPFRMLGIPYFVFIGLLNSVITVIYFKWIKDNSSNFSLSVLMFYSMFFFVWVLSAMRQSIVLALSLYFFFNKNKSLSSLHSIALVIILGFFHRSSYFLLIFLILREIQWSKRKHIYFITLSIIFTFLPIGKLVEYVEFIPMISKISDNYLNNVVKFYDFPGIIRLLIFLGCIMFYDKIPNKRNELDTLLFGTSLYFIFKFSEITASRGTIFSFMMIIIIIPDILSYLADNRKILVQISLTFLVFIGTLVYFTKEFNSMFDLAQYLEPKTILTYPNIFKKNIRSFGSLHSYEVDLYENVNEAYMSHLSSHRIVEKNYNDKQGYQPLLIDDKYFLIGQDGSFIPELESNYYFSIIDGVLVETYFRDSYFYPSKKFTDLTNKNRSEEDMKKIVVNHGMLHSSGYEEERLNFEYTDLPEKLKSYFPNENAVNDIYANKIYDNSGMIVVRILYHERVSYMYLTEEKEPILDFPTKQLRNYNDYDFFNIDIYGKTITVNQNGEIIHWR